MIRGQPTIRTAQILPVLLLSWILLQFIGSDVIAQDTNGTEGSDTSDTDLRFNTDDGWDEGAGGSFRLPPPNDYDTDLDYDPNSGEYQLQPELGDSSLGPSRSMSLDEYLQEDTEESIDRYWQEKKEAEQLNQRDPGFKPSLEVPGGFMDRIFGGNQIDIQPQGSAELTFGLNTSETKNPQIPERQRKITTFDFDQQIQLNVTGSIGDKMNLKTNYNTESQFDFQNQMKLEYTGYEDEIIKKIEAGNVSLPVNSSLISGSQSLFGVKAKLQFGRLKVTSVFSQQKGDKKEIEVKGGAQTQQFEFKADEYDRNQHYFLSHYFRNNYNEAMESLPQVASGIDITRVEVYVTNRNNNTQNTRNVVALSDLGESEGPDPSDPNYHQGMGIVDSLNGHLPSNRQTNVYDKVANNGNVRSFYNANTALAQMTNPGPFDPVEDYETLENAKKLNESEYTVNQRLGFISLDRSLDQDEVLAVAFEYTYQGETYQVGEFSTDGSSGQEALILKMLKSTNTNPTEKIWDLMMKNVYSINAYQMSKKNFDLQVLYNDPQQGVDINYIPQEPIDGKPLIRVLRCDQLNQNQRPYSDGVFDFVDQAATQGGTVESSKGKIFFPVVEPFGDHLRRVLEDGGVSEDVIRNIAFEPLYDSTVIAARQIPQLNRFKIKGSYESSVGSEINLNAMNIPEGSVKVTAGGVQLEEGKDYTVDYTLGRVKILNEGLLRSQTEINVSLESNSGFNVQTKRLMGSRFDYRVSEDLNLGATVLNLTERPLTQKVNIGNEPMSNTMIGADMSYQTESQFLTKMVDKIPGVDTKTESSIDFNAEYARLIPGHANAIGDEGNAYIDDFEGAQSAIDLRAISRWQMASTPQGQPDLFPEGSYNNDLRYNYNRANLAWYVIDPLFFRNQNITPDHIANDADMRSDHRMREVLEQEVFPNKELPQGTPPNIGVLDLAYYPSEKGQYNYDTDGSSVSEGLNADGSLKDPESRWAGIMRKLQTTDFEQSNIEYIQFWLMDPFNEDSENNSGGDLYFNLGNVSEDILKDNRKSFENGMPTTANPQPSDIDTTTWGRVPNVQSVVNAFDNDPSNRKFQDIGLDGLDSEQEREFFSSYLTQVSNVVNNNAYQAIEEDPSGDDYNYYRDDDYDDQNLNILKRYKKYNGLDGNSPTTEQSQSINDEGYPTSATTRPDAEDIDLDNNMNTTESYFQYHVSLRPPDMQVGQNFITDKRVAYPDVPNDNDKKVTWYQFKIPVRQFSKRVNNIQNFRSIRFMRIFLKNFEERVVLRFARLELIRGDWRRYRDFDLAEGEYPQDDPPETNFNVAAVNIEENANRDPIPYDLPPGITREVNNQSTNLSKLNEQSLSLEVCDLQDGDARAVYRNMEMDIRRYKRVKMFVHMESPEQNVDDEEVTLFLRFGTDFKRNYYEYEIPLEPTDHDATTPKEIWPEGNRIDLKLDLLRLAKKKRNALVSEGQMTYNEEYTLNKDGARVSVIGTPNLADMKTVMIGVRNPGRQSEHPWKPDDGRSKCFEVWVNELRLNQFEEEGGWAATAKMNAKLADLGNVSVSGNMSTPGFGGLEDKINDRQFHTKKRFNASSNISLSKFLPKDAGVNLPLYLGYSEGVEEPKYDPLNPDLVFDSSLARLEKQDRKKRRHRSVTYRKQRSLNLTNVSFEGSSEGDPAFYDPSNLSLSYSYNESFMRDINTQYNTQKTYNGNLNYSFSPSPPKVEPLKNVGFLKSSDYFQLIQDFNFKPYPNSISIDNNITRNYTEQQTRSNTDAITPPQANKEFDWTRNYTVTWDLTENLNLDYQASDKAIIGEPPGQIDPKRPDDTNRFGYDYHFYKDTVMRNIKRFGENTSFQQSVNASYQVPLSKIPATDWMQITAQYNTSFDWQRAPFSQDSLGNTIQNSRKMNLNGNLDMSRLYGKVGFLKEVQKKFKGGGGRRRRKGRKSMQGRDENDGGDDDEEDSGPSILDHALNFMMSLKKINFTYSRSEGTRLPGYDRKTQMVGMDPDFDAPGYKFLLGHQDKDFKYRASERGWLVEEPNLNREYQRNESEQMEIRATLRPANRLRVEINASRQESWNRNSYFRWDDSLETHVDQSPQRTGDLSMSILTWRTAFIGSDSTGASPTFDQFKENRRTYSEQYGEEHSGSSLQQNGYYDGYGNTQQNVVVSSFLAAYMGQKPKNVEKNPFNMLPKPNWSVSYDGLSQVAFFEEYMKNFSLSHSYRSRVSTSYQTPLQYRENENGDPIERNQDENFIPRRRMQTVSISESFSPLLGIDITWDNDLVTKFEIKKSRNLSLSLSNYQVNEVKSQEYTIGTGYSFKDVVLPFEILGNELKSDLKLRGDVSIRDNKTYIRKMVEDQNEITSGQRVVSIKTSADYTISKRLNIRFFYDRTVNEPYISTTYPTANTNVGLTLRLTLAQ